jgi:hypothetical protein
MGEVEEAGSGESPVPCMGSATDSRQVKGDRTGALNGGAFGKYRIALCLPTPIMANSANSITRPWPSEISQARQVRRQTKWKWKEARPVKKDRPCVRDNFAPSQLHPNLCCAEGPNFSVCPPMHSHFPPGQDVWRARHFLLIHSERGTFAASHRLDIRALTLR